MFTLLYILTIPAYLGTYQDMRSCQHVIREIYASRLNIKGQRDPQVEKTIDTFLQAKREFICVPTKG